jgi:DNA-binding XRE family transcriptional regulator
MAKSRLRELREREGLTATDLARLSDVSTRTMIRQGSK